MLLAVTETSFVDSLPAVNASLNALTTVTLLAGFICIKLQKKVAHAAFMISSLISSAAFLTFYVSYHVVRGTHYFTTEGWPKILYYFILIPHVLLAIAILPFIFAAVYYASKRQFESHKKITRWLWPAWMYVSVTGVLVYLMLYVFFPNQPRVGL
jgi:putative membrane protein